MTFSIKKWKRDVALLATLCSMYALAQGQTLQSAQVDHYTPQDLHEQVKPLIEKATATGGSSEILQKYGADYTMLAFHSKDGGAELHEKYADIFIIVDGSATLLSGGELESPATSAPGEVKGTALLHATRTLLAKGDIVHIPANTPHQLLIPSNTTLTYFVIKIKERE
jgi:mannose-6-phosphate isomerase-like protein (cupin superfamily)